MSLGKSFLTVSGFTLISRITGFVRDIFIAAMVGTGVLAEIFFVAFKFPNFFRRLFGEGAFSAAFVPMFSAKLASDGKEEAEKFASKILSMLFTSLFIFIILMEIFMPYVMMVLAPGFANQSNEKYELAVYLTRVTFPYLLFISLVSLFAGILNSMGKFASVAFTPVLLNITLILSLLFLTDYSDSPAHALSYGVVVAGIIQFLWLLMALKKQGVKLQIQKPSLSPESKTFLKRMGPGIIGAGIVQINLWIDLIIGTLIPGAIAYLYYADRINQLPLSLIGTAMGVALLPTLSKQVKAKKFADAIETQNRALETVLFFIIPATAALMVIALPIVTTLFQRGEFTSYDSLATSYGLIAYACGLPAFAMVKIFSSTFFAMGDTKTPVKIAVLCMLINIFANIASVIFLIDHDIMPHIGLALSTSISSWINIIILGFILMRRKKFLPDRRIKIRFLKVIFSSIIMAGILLFITDIYEYKLMGSLYDKIEYLITLVMAGSATYLLLAFTIGAADIKTIRNRIRGK